jgi:hypothetical protein
MERRSDKSLTTSIKSLVSLTGGNGGFFNNFAQCPADQGHFACPQR